MNTQYVYMFIRQDLSPQQQIIQMSHATFDLGNKLGLSNIESAPHAVLMGAKNEDHLHAIRDHLDENQIEYELFFEPDISSYTALTTYPISGERRLPLRKFKTI